MKNIIYNIKNNKNFNNNIKKIINELIFKISLKVKFLNLIKYLLYIFT